MKKVWLLLAFLATLAFVAACDDDPGNPPEDTDQTDTDVTDTETTPDQEVVTGCQNNNDCAGDPAGEVCNTATNECVECLADGDCGADETCNTTTNLCIPEVTGCTSDADCTGSLPVCDTVNEVCVECLVDGDCGAGETCDTTTNMCAAAGCESNADCADPLPVCKMATGVCVECMVPADCGTGETCNTTTNLCIPETTGCTSNTDCSDPTPVCNTATQVCVECVLTTDCGAGETCTNNVCVAGNCDNNGFTSVVDYFQYDGAQGYGALQAFSGLTETDSQLSLQMYAGFGDPPPTFGPGTTVIGATAAEQNYAICGTCLLVYTADKTFFATSGTIVFTALSTNDGDDVIGTLTDVELVEVTIDPNDYTSTPVVGGENWCIPSYAIDSLVNAICETNADCNFDPETPFCSNGGCVECLVDGDCTTAGETCSDGTCMAPLPAEWTCPAEYYGDTECDCGCGALDADCASGAIAECIYDMCQPLEIDPTQNWLCIDPNACTVDGDCATNAIGPWCDTTAGQCVECYLDSHCDTTASETCYNNACKAPAVCAMTGIDPFIDSMTFYYGDFWTGAEYLVFSGSSAAADPMQSFFVIMDFAVTAGTYDLATEAGAQLVVTDAAGTESVYLSTAGSITITEVGTTTGAPFVATIADLELTLDGGTDVWCIPTLALSTTYEGGTECTSDADCTTEHPVCDVAAGYCIPTAGWTCNIMYYEAGDGCDCGCGAWDPDCDVAGDLWCNGTVTDGAYCDATSLECADCTIDDNCALSADGAFCDTTSGACVECVIDANCPNAGDVCTNNACVVGGWTCSPVYYQDGSDCDCGCGIWDPDCDDTTLDVWCEADGTYGAPGTTCDTTTLVCVAP